MDPNGIVVSTGYNGFPVGCSDEEVLHHRTCIHLLCVCGSFLMRLSLSLSLSHTHTLSLSLSVHCPEQCTCVVCWLCFISFDSWNSSLSVGLGSFMPLWLCHSGCDLFRDCLFEFIHSSAIVAVIHANSCGRGCLCQLPWDKSGESVLDTKFPYVVG